MNRSDNPYYLLLVKYQGDLMNASPNELKIAERKCGTINRVRRSKRQAIERYEKYYDERGQQRFRQPKLGY